jgi:hypothetical protein
MDTKYIFAKESGLSNMSNSILWHMYFVKIPNETISFSFILGNGIFFINNMALE